MSDIISYIKKKSWCIWGSARHGGLYDSLCSLVALLKSGEWDTYRIFFVGAMFLVEGTNGESTLLFGHFLFYDS